MSSDFAASDASIKPARLALGTVQFGLAYGVANSAGQVTRAEVAGILATARAGQIDLLDTAEAYGEAEAVLGASDTTGFEVVGKLAEITPGEALQPRLNASLARLGRTQLYGLLLHRPAVLLTKDGPAVWRALEALQGAGKLGVSVYTPDETLHLLDRYPLSLVQLPLAPIDARWADVLIALKTAGVEVHSRSALLQGLLAQDPRHRAPYFAPWTKLLDGWHDWVAAQALSPAHSALALVRTTPGIDRVVIGVDSTAQLRDLLAAPDTAPPLPADLLTDDPALLNPALWSLS